MEIKEDLDMRIKNLIKWSVLGAALMAGTVQADRVFFTGAGGSDNWLDANNWSNKDKQGAPGVPGDADQARIPGGVVVKITNAVTVGNFKCGSTEGTGTAQVTIDGGSLVTGKNVDYNSACYNVPGTLIVQNGGSAVFNTRFMVGFLDAQGGSLVIHDGTVRVADIFYQNMKYTGTDILNTRTTINTGGVLDVNDLILNAGVMDVAGGTLIIRRSILHIVEQWIIDGRIIPMGGQPGWKLKVTPDDATGWITIVAEAMTEPFTVGMLEPVATVPFCPAI